ncbi:MAG: iron complex outermembrane recepter protein [Alphaproteobacteria bacterium]|nr:MAG: iron complex outermembrane recepter protein [Alphaproteobacteria bacterium]
MGAVYLVKFEDRLLGIRQGAGIIGNPSIISNVGGVETKGIELAGTYDVTDNWTAFASYAYNDSTYEDNVVDATGVILQRTAGATVVNTPEHLFKTDLSYDNGSLFGNISASYTGARQQDFTNATGEVDGFTVVDMSAGYRFEGEGPIGGLELRLNVTNLLDEDYVSTIGTNGFTSGNAFFNQSLMVGAPRQVFVTVRKTF